MKFRKLSTSSPKMELLSRRSSSDRMSTLKRSRSFRASMKLMSKLRSRASMRLNGGFDFSPASLQRSKKKRPSLIEEVPPNTAEENPSIEDRGRSRTDNENTVLPDDRLSEFQSRNIAEELSKLRLAGHPTTEKDREGNGAKKCSDAISPKVTTRMLRWKSNVQEEEEEEKKCPFPATTGGHHASYENPTFRLDASLDSSMSAFFFEDSYRDEDRVAEEEDDEASTMVDSKKGGESGQGGCVLFRDDYRATKELGREKSGRAVFTGAKARSLSVNDVVVVRDEVVAASSLVLSAVGCVEDASKGVGKSSSEKIRKTSVCSSKSCRIRTVDNIANFWTNARGGSFRSKVSVGRKKSMKESREHDSMGQDRVLVTTISGSSTAHQVSLFLITFHSNLHPIEFSF